MEMAYYKYAIFFYIYEVRLSHPRSFYNLGNKLILFVTIISVFIVVFTIHDREKYKPNFKQSYYYWRTEFSLSPKEKEKLIKGRIEKLYIRYFDVSIRENKIEILAPITWQDTIHLDVTPVVFIKNVVFKNLTSSEIKDLAKDIFTKIEKLHQGSLEEIQIDCDWTKTTKLNYFLFLKYFKEATQKNIKLSATLRLHQLKFPDIAGIPPVERLTLMIYNVDEFDDIKSKNSIFDQNIIFDYLGNEEKYPLPLDFALPVFDQLILFRDNIFITYFRNGNIDQLFNSDLLLKQGNTNLYSIKYDTLFETTSLLKGDIIRYESVNSGSVNTIINQIKYQSNEPRNLIWYDLNARNNDIQLKLNQ